MCIRDRQITALTEYIKGYERDMQLAAENPKPENGFAGMEIMGEYYTCLLYTSRCV